MTNAGDSPSTKGTILLAEDHESSAFAVSEFLRAKGYAVQVASDGEAALASARLAPPTLILMDIQMPRVDGLSAIESIRAIEKLAAIPIIALTALAMPKDKQRCLDAGADDVVIKPVRLRLLLEKIEELLVG